jgi:transposase
MIRRPGAGPKRRADKDPTLLQDLDLLVDPATRGDPMSPLRWSCKSTRNLAEALTEQGHKVSAQTVAELLREQGYSLQVNFKTREGNSRP